MTQMLATRSTERPLPAGPREHLSSPVTRSVLTIQHRMLTAARDFLRGQGFTELLPPIVGPVTDPGARGAKQVDVDYYGHRYKLMTSAILYKQASLTAFNKIFCIAPNVRLEPLETATTGRHLAYPERTPMSNLYVELLELLGQTDPSLAPEPPVVYAAACRWAREGDAWHFRAWTHTLVVGQPLPLLPLWLAENLAVPLELEATYEETCRILRIP